MKYIARIKGKEFKIDIEEKQGQLEVILDNQPVSVDFSTIKHPNFLSLLLDNLSYDAEVISDSRKYFVTIGGNRYECTLEDERFARLKDFAGIRSKKVLEKEFKTPMPGLVVAVEVNEGDEVKSGDGMVIVEAMKMENELKASFDGKIKKICVKVGQPVEKDEVLVVFE
ncbi:MAG: hypothetical protein AMJ90_03080 [candidate division Zixibacteria bacterium SM23_73_2]|nr:MAG: hypothetical protein AMJ90_03080 [candidate division Zixibacteria bacterium SM23_73_2]